MWPPESHNSAPNLHSLALSLGLNLCLILAGGHTLYCSSQRVGYSRLLGQVCLSSLEFHYYVTWGESVDRDAQIFASQLCTS